MRSIAQAAGSRGDVMSHGIRVEDIAWQAYQAGARSEGLTVTDAGALTAARDKFLDWWATRTEQGCALPECQRCGFDPSAKVSASWTFELDREVKSGNAHVFNVGASRWRYGKDRTEWEWEIRAVRLLQKIPLATARRRVTLTRLYGGRQRPFDGDNLAFGLKPAVDAIVREGLLLGDDAKRADIIYRQEAGGRGLRIVLEDIG